MATPRKVTPHPNSTAARKWGRTEWTSYLPARARPARGQRARLEDARTLFVLAAHAAANGERERAAALRAKAARLSAKSFHCR